MKRCPTCNRIEADEALAFCRADGTALISDSGPVGAEAGTVKFGSSPVATEIETSILPQAITDAVMSRPTAPTSVLPAPPTPGKTRELSRSKRRTAVAAIAAVIAVALAASAYFYLSQKNRTAIESVAVLPFVNTSGDPNMEYLSDGISEALINSLTELQQLKVVARSTAFRYKGKDVDPQQVGRELNVQSVLMGRVRQVGDVLDVQVDLVDASTGAQLWGAEYERKLSDVLAVKQAIAREVTEKLRLRLSGEQQKQLVRRDTTNAEAYQSYLRGRYFWNRRSGEGIKKATEQFQQAIDRDPNYALAYAGLADCYLLLEQYTGTPASETLPKARAAANRALQLDDSMAEAHTSLANIYQGEWRWAEAEEEYKRAISLNPNYPTAHHWFSIYYAAERQFDSALSEIRRAHELDPLSPIIGSTTAMAHLLNDDPISAIEQSKKVIDIEPSFPSAHLYLGWAYLKQQRPEDAAAELEKAVELSGRASFYQADLGYFYAVAGRRGDALKILKELEEKYSKRESTAVSIAIVHAGLGAKDQAFAWLERAFQHRGGDLSDVTWWFVFDDLRSDPRYADLVRRMGLPQ